MPTDDIIGDWFTNVGIVNMDEEICFALQEDERKKNPFLFKKQLKCYNQKAKVEKEKNKKLEEKKKKLEEKNENYIQTKKRSMFMFAYKPVLKELKVELLEDSSTC